MMNPFREGDLVETSPGKEIHTLYADNFEERLTRLHGPPPWVVTSTFGPFVRVEGAEYGDLYNRFRKADTNSLNKKMLKKRRSE